MRCALKSITAVVLFFMVCSLASSAAFGSEAAHARMEDDSLIWLVTQPTLPDVTEGRLQPPPAPRPTPTVPVTTTAPTTYKPRYLRLASLPRMFGDMFPPIGETEVIDGAKSFQSDVPLAAGLRRNKVSENNKAAPTDRIFFMYNHFHDVLSARYGTVLDPVDRYTFGFEKTFLDEMWSVEVRVPFVDQGFRYEQTVGPPLGFSDIRGGEAGNMTLILKRLVHESESTAVAVGLGVDLPTGSDVSGVHGAGILFGQSENYKIYNEAVHLLPYIGVTSAPNDLYFWNGFLQLDIATNGNPVELTDGITDVLLARGVLTEQNLFHVDFARAWLLRDTEAPMLTGLASVVELHYSTTIQNADIAKATLATRTYKFGNRANRQDILNLTFGLHAELFNQTKVRVGGVVPLRTGDDRLFDSEVQVQINRDY